MKSAVLLFGGPSDEYEISLRSAAAVLRVARDIPYHLVPVVMTKKGDLFLCRADADAIENGTFEERLCEGDKLLPTRGGFAAENGSFCLSPCVIFPLTHGGFGEDGRLQGLLSYAGVPFVGCKTEGAAKAMNKLLAKTCLRGTRIKTARSMTLTERDFDKAAKRLGLPFFLKPVSGGSSVGAGIVKCREDFKRLFPLAKKCGDVMAEEYVRAREIEVAVIEDEHGVTASCPGEVIPAAEFYDYADKYEKATATLRCPAALPEPLSRRVRRDAVRIFRTLGGRSLSRVDFFLTEDGRLLFNEMNALPGFTRDSLYPRLICHTLAVTEGALVTRLLDFAVARP